MLVAALGVAAGAGVVVWVLPQSDAPALPPALKCGACEGRALDGAFRGQYIVKLGLTSVITNVTATFNSSARTVLWENVGVKDPLHMVPKMHCPGVRFSLSESNCTVQGDDDCTRASMTKAGVLEKRTTWDGADTIVEIERIKLPVVGVRQITITMSRIRPTAAAAAAATEL